MSVTPLLVSVAFIVFDVLTGWLKAAITATLNSSIMRTGLLRKLGEILSILFGYVCQYSLPYLGLEVKFPFAGAIGTYIVLMETASIIENLCAINPNMREALSKVFDDNKLPVVKEDEHGKHERTDT